MQVKSYVSRLIDPRKIRRKKHRDDQEIDEQRNGSHCKRGEESRQHLTFTYAFLETRVHICMS